MNILINSIYNYKFNLKDKAVNIYAFILNDTIYIECLDIQYSLKFLTTRIREKIIDSIISKIPSDKRNSPSIRREVSSGFNVLASVHLIYDREQNSLMLTKDNDEPRISSRGTDKYNLTVSLIRTVSSWISKTESIFGKVDKSKMIYQSSNSLFLNRNFSIIKIKDFKNIVDICRKENINIDKILDIDVILFDYSDEDICKYLEKQIGNNFLNSKIYLNKTHFNINGKNFTNQTILCDRKGLTIYQLESLLFPFICKNLGISTLKTSKAHIARQQQMGVDSEEFFFLHFSNPKEISKAAKTFDKDASLNSLTAFQEIVNDLDIQENSEEILNFLKILFIYNKSFSWNFTKIYYSIFSIPLKNNDDNIVDKNIKLFNKFFKIRGGPLNSETRSYFMVSSKYIFPQYIFSLFFNDQQSVSLHETIVFKKIGDKGLLSKYFLDNVPKDEDSVFYKTNVLNLFPKIIGNLLGNNITDNRFSEKVIIKTLSEFFYVYGEVKQIFDKFEIPYQDIDVVLTFDPANIESLGGLVTPENGSSSTISLMKDYADFKLPIIILNIANKKMQNREYLSTILIHEGSHFVDYLRKTKKNEDPSVFDASYMHLQDYKTMEERRMFFEKYLSTPTEINAFVNSILSILRRYSLDYLENNWTYVKTRIIDQVLTSREDQGNKEGESDIEDCIEYFSSLVDKAFEKYKEENSPT